MLRLVFLLILIPIFGLSQELITGSYNFQNDPEKKFALYIPSEYNEDVPSKVIVGLHPWNTSKWNAETWTEELSELAEANNCIIISPDGGIDGQVDDEIDTAFTTFLINEIDLQYNLNRDSMYLIGFSWGGRTVYTYGLTHSDLFDGFMPIGAAVELSVVEALSESVEHAKFYVLHGGNDTPSIRFHPLVAWLEENQACLATNLMPGVGHTIEFNDQLERLNTGLQYLINTSCAETTSVNEIENELIPSILTLNYPTPFRDQINREFRVYNSEGQLIHHLHDSSIPGLEIIGTYIVKVEGFRPKIVIVN